MILAPMPILTIFDFARVSEMTRKIIMAWRNWLKTSLQSRDWLDKKMDSDRCKDANAGHAMPTFVLFC
jgi:hypothetical protein